MEGASVLMQRSGRTKAVAHNPPALKQQRDRAKKGFNLIEAAIVLGVVGFVLGGIWVAAAAVKENWKVQETAGGILASCSKVGQLFPRLMTQTSSEIGGWADVGLFAAAAGGVFPVSWVRDLGYGFYDVKPPIGEVEDVYITASDVVWLGSNAGNILILVIGLSQAQCQKLVANTASRVSNSSGSLLAGISVKHYESPGSPFSQSYTQTDYGFPISLTPTDVDCSGTYNAVEFSCVRQ